MFGIKAVKEVMCVNSLSLLYMLCFIRMSLTGKNKLKLLVHFLSPDMTSSFCMSDVVWTDF